MPHVSPITVPAARVPFDAYEPSRRFPAGIAAAGSPVCPCGARLPLPVKLHLRSRTRPVFEGRWCCSPACLHARIAAAVRREARKDPVRRPHQHRIPLGLLLLSSRSISQAELNRALELQRQTGDLLGNVLSRDCGVPERTVAEALSVQWGCPVWDVQGTRLERMAAIAPRAVLEGTGVVPLRWFRAPRLSAREFSSELESRLTVAFPDAIDSRVVFALRWMHDVIVEAGVTPTSQGAAARDVVLNAESIPAEEAHCGSIAEMESAIIRTLRRLQPVESRWVRVADIYWLRLWLEPAALMGGPLQVEDVRDFVFHLPKPARSQEQREDRAA